MARIPCKRPALRELAARFIAYTSQLDGAGFAGSGAGVAGAGAGVAGSDVVAGALVSPSFGLLSHAAKVSAATAATGKKNLKFIMFSPVCFVPIHRMGQRQRFEHPGIFKLYHALLDKVMRPISAADLSSAYCRDSFAGSRVRFTSTRTRFSHPRAN